jgi:hypothetical protein|nr:MAG TPA: hypothetical protein [Caudoviricetes sp.]
MKTRRTKNEKKICNRGAGAGRAYQEGGGDMTKEEIVKTLRACEEHDCSSCKYRLRKEPFCVDALIRDAADLIEAQAAEIERLKAQVPGVEV